MLLVEDNYLVAITLKSMIEYIGFHVIGPVPSVEDGLLAAESESLDAAVLDINIVGGTSIPLAGILQRRGCPIVFITGYGSPRMLPESMASIRRLNKPIDTETLQEALTTIMT